jgi:hypothetical protein
VEADHPQQEPLAAGGGVAQIGPGVWIEEPFY